MKIRQKRLELPSREEFLKFVDAIQNAGARQSKDCANLVCFLAYSGLRIGEARHVTWADVNFWNYRHVTRFSVFLWRFPDLLGRVTGGNCLATTMSVR
jgi:integrase